LVCLELGNIDFYEAIMEAFQMNKYSETTFIRSFLQRFGLLLAATAAAILIENTYEQLP
jgi:hypothetical protein